MPFRSHIFQFGYVNFLQRHRVRLGVISKTCRVALRCWLSRQRTGDGASIQIETFQGFDLDVGESTEVFGFEGDRR